MKLRKNNLSMTGCGKVWFFLDYYQIITTHGDSEFYDLGVEIDVKIEWSWFASSFICLWHLSHLTVLLTL